MKFRKLLSTLLAAALMCGLACTAALADEPADGTAAPDSTATEGTGQKIVVGEETYDRLLAAIISEKEDKAVTVRLDSDVQLTGFAVVLGTSDYDGAMGGQEVTVASHNVTIDLNGFTLKAEAGKAVFEVQAGYTLTIVDNSEAKTGKLEAEVDPVTVAEGAVYNALPAPETPTDPEPTDPEPTTPTAPTIPAEGTAYASTQNIAIDGKAVEFAAYALKDENGNLTNYVKLRDLGEVLGFAVGYSNETGISITTTAPAAE